jgi:hypothetical protein
MRRRIAQLAAVAAVTIAALAPAATGRPLTTAPGAPAYVKVSITDRAVTIGSGSSATRGDWIIFEITNRSRSTAKLSFLGRTSKAIAPKHRGPLAVFAQMRGAFPVVVSLAPHRSFTRTFVVY